jgi:amino-acid N-acetyltransferase
MTDVTVGQAREDERESVLALLEHHSLPTDGLADVWSTTLVARAAGAVVGSAALELYRDGALLRSVAVSEAQRGQGIGHHLIHAAIHLATEQGAADVYLLTTTAERFFPRFGFEAVRREDVPPSVQTSVEFTSACPASAVVMRKHL